MLCMDAKPDIKPIAVNSRGGEGCILKEPQRADVSPYALCES